MKKAVLFLSCPGFDLHIFDEKGVEYLLVVCIFCDFMCCYKYYYHYLNGNV